MSNDNETTNGTAAPGNGAEAPDGAAPEAASAAQPASAPEAAETAEQKITRLEREKAEARDRMLRVAADFENYKRRSKRDMDDAAIHAKEQILREVLPVLDNLDR